MNTLLLYVMCGLNLVQILALIHLVRRLRGLEQRIQPIVTRLESAAQAAGKVADFLPTLKSAIGLTRPIAPRPADTGAKRESSPLWSRIRSRLDRAPE